MRPVEIIRSIRENNEQVIARRHLQQEPDERQRRRIRPLQVVDDDRDRAVARKLGNQGRQGLVNRFDTGIGCVEPVGELREQATIAGRPAPTAARTASTPTTETS
jgi:hypothetical protein